LKKSFQNDQALPSKSFLKEPMNNSKKQEILELETSYTIILKTNYLLSQSFLKGAHQSAEMLFIEIT